MLQFFFLLPSNLHRDEEYFHGEKTEHEPHQQWLGPKSMRSRDEEKKDRHFCGTEQKYNDLKRKALNDEPQLKALRNEYISFVWCNLLKVKQMPHSHVAYGITSIENITLVNGECSPSIHQLNLIKDISCYVLCHQNCWSFFYNFWFNWHKNEKMRPCQMLIKKSFSKKRPEENIHR